MHVGQYIKTILMNVHTYIIKTPLFLTLYTTLSCFNPQRAIFMEYN